MPKTVRKATRAATAVVAAKKRRETARRKALRQQGEAKLDEALRGLGVEDPAEDADEDGWRHFASVDDIEAFAFVDTTEPEVTLNVAAEMMPLPSDAELVVPLMRELLETNPLLAGPARLGIRGDSVYATFVDTVELMEDDDYRRALVAVATLASSVAPSLRKRYGGTTKKRQTSASRGRRRPSR